MNASFHTGFFCRKLPDSSLISQSKFVEILNFSVIKNNYTRCTSISLAFGISILAVRWQKIVHRGNLVIKSMMEIIRYFLFPISELSFIQILDKLNSQEKIHF